MKKGLTEIVFILDESGSMIDLKADTMGGYNGFLEKQKAIEGEALVSTVFFSSSTKVIHDRISIKEVQPLNKDDYSPMGYTSLLDAVGGAIHHIGNVHKYARDEDRPEKTIFVIITDGEENSSCCYTYDRVKQMISRQQEKYGWEFIYLGANMDVVKESARLGIRADRAVLYECDSEGTQINFETISETIGTYRTENIIPSTWDDSIKAYKKSK